jgi:phosphoribulokinase
MQGGVGVTVTIVALLWVAWVEKPGHEQGGSRKIVTDAILMNIVNSSS